MQRYIDSNGLPGLISTFGFGYSLDSKLLQEISQTGGGQYAFIPDAGLVGTIFVHAIANIMTTALRNCTIAIEDGQKPIGHRLVGTNVEVSTVHYGQPKNVVLDLGDSQGTVYVKITGMMPDKSLEKTVEFSARGTTQSDFKDDLWRLKFVQECWNAFEQMPANREQAITRIKTLAEEIERIPQTEFLKSLLVDIKGQATEAFKSGYYEKWGRHYIPSLLYAHRNQICNNFKDPGVQNYGGTLFKKIRDTADDLFSSLPAPKPSGTRSHYYGAQSGGSAPVVSMAAYNNSGYVCFHGDCLVAMNSGMKKISKLRKGDVLKSGAIVDCLVESKVQSMEMVRLDDLIITPFHPVLHRDTEWVFPADLQPAQTMNPESIYSVLTSGPPSIKVSGYTCATLGHNLTGPVIGHPFFGTNKVRTSLQELIGWSQGYVVITDVLRDENGLITGLVQ